MCSNLNTQAAEPGQKAKSKKGIISVIIKWDYSEEFRFGDPLRQMFDHASQAQKNECPNFEKLRENSEESSELGVLTQVLYVKNCDSMYREILRSFGNRFGYYNPKDLRQIRFLDLIIETWADLQDALTTWIFS